jgi:E3 ubiquitin-protein ligase DOA10
MNDTEKKDIDLKDDTDCVICFSEMNKDEEQLEGCDTCKKYFHQECINRWKQHNATCPLCRGALVGSGNNPLDKLKQIVV